jgi:FlgD Ig-like domain
MAAGKSERIYTFGFKTVFIAFVSFAFLILPGIVSCQNTNKATTSNLYTFSLNRAATTSAGVYNSTDSSLVRTLWSAKHYDAGTYRIEWDGKDDLGNPAPTGNYIVKVVSNNVKYTWQGVIGNTSDSDTGSTVHRGYLYCMTGMTITNGTAYYCTGYSEGSPCVAKFLTSKPQRKLDIERYNVTTANTDFVVNDGTTVYWAGYDPFASSNTFVWGTKLTNDAYVTFSGGISFKLKYSKSYNTIGYMHRNNSSITGLAVQKTGRFLFIARAKLNQLYALDKVTGQLLQTISITNPKALCIDMNDNLWMVADNNNVTSIGKYKVNADGTLSAPVLTISGVLRPKALAVSPDNGTMAIADEDISSQQVKAFNNSTGSPLWTLGTPGGYKQDATVTNNKFYFNDERGRMYPAGDAGFPLFIAFQPDGSFWVNDPGNFRVQHYTAGRVFVETIMALGASYSTWADKNDNTRVGAEYLEFKINNSQPITGTTGWKLLKNWGANVSAGFDKTIKFTNVITLTSAGVKRTFGFLCIGAYYHLVEFQRDNTLRFTNISMFHCNIDKDGSVLTDSFTRLPFLGFDNKNNPIWSTMPVSVANPLLLPDNGPLPKQRIKNTYVTSTGKIVLYDYGIYLSRDIYNTGFHLGAIQQDGNSWLWKTALATNVGYAGPFPDPGYYDIGNHVNYNAGSSIMVLNRNIITGYHGEFWKSSQTNMYNHYLDNGLAIGQFGTVGPKYSLAPAMMAGNALSPQLVYGDNSDEMYLWHGDESYHSGMHKWKISGLSTIHEQDIPITYPSSALVPATTPGNNLMADLPRDSPLSNNTAGWTYSPSTIDAASALSPGWSIKTNALVYGIQNNPDVYVKCYSATGTFSINRDLGNNTGLAKWTLSGQISYDNGGQGGFMQQYFDILDNKEKIIARISNKFVFVSNSLGTNKNTIYGNNKILVSGLNDSFIQPIESKLQPVSISAGNNLITIKYAGYSVTTSIFDPTADITSPKTMRTYIVGGAVPTGRNFDFKDMRFITK